MIHGIPGPGFRLPSATSLGAVSLLVSDLDRSLAFYEALLGFSVQDRSRSHAVLTAQGESRPLIYLIARPGVRPQPRPAPLGLYHFAILLPARASLGRVIAQLADAGARVAAADHLVSEAIYLSDPDGLGVEIYADRPRTSWRYQGAQLAMATDPLDRRDLVAAGGAVPWAGMPPGTVIGHVHLHVGDLTEAEAFYHCALGFDKMVWTYPGALFMAAGGYHHHLGTNTWSQGPRAAADHARLLHWDIIVPTKQDASAAAHSLTMARRDVVPDGAGWAVTDPWGTALRIVPNEP